MDAFPAVRYGDTEGFDTRLWAVFPDGGIFSGFGLTVATSPQPTGNPNVTPNRNLRPIYSVYEY